MYQLDLAAITKYQILGDFKQEFIFHISEDRKAKIQVSSQSLLRALSWGWRWLCPHMIFPECMPVEKDREKASSLVFLLIRILMPSWRPSFLTLSKPNYFPKAPSPNTTILGVRAPIYEFLEYSSIYSVYVSKAINDFRPWENIFQTRETVIKIYGRCSFTITKFCHGFRILSSKMAIYVTKKQVANRMLGKFQVFV